MELHAIVVVMEQLPEPRRGLRHGLEAAAGPHVAQREMGPGPIGRGGVALGTRTRRTSVHEADRPEHAPGMVAEFVLHGWGPAQKRSGTYISAGTGRRM